LPERCSTSGRFTPAQATSIRIWPGPGVGAGPSASVMQSASPPLPWAMYFIGLRSMLNSSSSLAGAQRCFTRSPRYAVPRLCDACLPCPSPAISPTMRTMSDRDEAGSDIPSSAERIPNACACPVAASSRSRPECSPGRWRPLRAGRRAGRALRPGGLLSRAALPDLRQVPDGTRTPGAGVRTARRRTSSRSAATTNRARQMAEKVKADVACASATV
jgi:hypothetical protein